MSEGVGKEQLPKFANLAAIKVVPKSNVQMTICRVIVYKEMIDANRWKHVSTKPKAFIYDWSKNCLPTAVHRDVQDSWGFNQEDWEGRITMTGLLNIPTEHCENLLKVSGRGHVIVEPMRWQDPLPKIRVDWIPKIPGESPVDYWERVLMMRPDFGMARGLRQLGLRSAATPDAPLSRVWVLDAVPREWTEEQALDLLKGAAELTELAMLRQQARGPLRAWWFRAKAAPDQDVIPLPYKSDDDDHMEVAWVRRSTPPKPKEHKEKPFKGGALIELHMIHLHYRLMWSGYQLLHLKLLESKTRMLLTRMLR